jgi:uncharacterized RDD family membrane protein YckC
MPAVSAPARSAPPEELITVPAAMWRRLMARVVDLVAVATWVFALSITHIFIHLQLWSDSVAPEPWGNWFLAMATIVVAYAAYEICFVAKTGATPGKDFMGIHVVDAATGARPSWGQAVRRWLPMGLVQPIPVVWVGALLTGLFGATAYADAERRSIYDRMANTRVLSKAPPADADARATRRQQFTPRFIDPLAVYRLARSNPKALRRHPDDADS